MLQKVRQLLFFASILVIAAIAVCVYSFLNTEPEADQGFCGTSNPPSYVNDSIIDGKLLFNANCASCHKMDRKLTGPALLGARDRWINVKLLKQHIMNAKLVRK
jgi:hypothetical protein